MQLSELLKSAGIEGSLKDLPHIHTLTSVCPSYKADQPEDVYRTVEGNPVSFEVVTTSREVVLALTRLDAQQLYLLLSCLRGQIRNEVDKIGKSEEMIMFALNGKTFVASEVRTNIHGKVVIHIS